MADQLTSALSEPVTTQAISEFQEAAFDLDDMLGVMGLDRRTRMNAIVGATARCLLERYEQT